MTDIKGIVCSQCGAVEVTVIDESFAKCNHCGAQLKIENNGQVISTIVVKHVGQDEKGDSPAIAFAKVKENHVISDFTRTAYVDLFTSSVTDDVCNAEFSPAVTKTYNYVMVTGRYDIHYSASLGYDRTETYLGTEKKKLSDGSYIEEVVEKKRTVTDWRPTNGVYEGKCNAVVEIGENPESNSSCQLRFDHDILPDFKNSVDITTENDKIPAPFTISQSDLKNAYDWGADIASSACIKSLGGDHKKNFQYTYKEKPKAIIGITSNEFVLPFSIGENKYRVKSFSNNIKTHSNAPSIDDLYLKNWSANNKKSKKSFILPPIALGLTLFLLAFIIGLIATGYAELGATLGIIFGFFPMGIAFIVWWWFHFKIWNSISQKQADLQYQQIEQKKYNRLVELLKEMNFEPLTKEEKLRFKHLNQQEATLRPIEKFVIWIENFSFSKKK